ncbi:hypothetical protein A8B79_00795 [Balneola sp. EhC07]|uniref:hypothetical protein n=1 Tax=Balneola sp. EhC07 TaxID=1849360 RepID=UPI0007F4D21C|nr:hypothetical protein [Balneola sp. EhC07]MBO6571638.1 hypothetical protein [Balneola sp.]OAN64714.1 hypothetical protein A8B79_00795 [Balneola sp. EhC07]
MKKNIQYRYTNIFLVSSNIIEPRVSDINEAIGGQPIKIQTETSYDKDTNECFLDIRVMLQSKLTNEELIDVRLRSSFIIKGIEAEDIDKEENIGILETLVSLSYSSTRGYLASLLTNYRYKDKVFLPVVPPKKLIEKKAKENKDVEKKS